MLNDEQLKEINKGHYRRVRKQRMINTVGVVSTVVFFGLLVLVAVAAVNGLILLF